MTAMLKQEGGLQAEATTAEQGGQREKQAPKNLISITSHGITLELDQEKFNDLELFDMIDEIQSGNVFKMPKLMRHIFGDQHKVVLDGLRNDQGIVTADKASGFLIEVLQQINPNS